MKIKQRIQIVLCKSISVVWVSHFSRSLREVGIFLSADPRSVLRLLLAAHGAQIDPQLFRFLIQVTALQAKSFRGQAHVLMAALQFRENHFALERLHAIGERAGASAVDATVPPEDAFGSAICTVARSTWPSVASSMSRSTILRNSRTFPGHA